MVSRVPPVSWMPSSVHRPARRRHDLRELALVEAFAAERHQQRAADVGMRAQLFHHRRARRRSDSSRESRSGARRRRGTARRSRARRGARTRPGRRRPARCGCPCGRRRGVAAQSFMAQFSCSCHGTLPSPQPSPRKRGEGAASATRGGQELLPLPPQAGEGWGEGGAANSAIGPSYSRELARSRALPFRRYVPLTPTLSPFRGEGAATATAVAQSCSLSRLRRERAGVRAAPESPQSVHRSSSHSGSA